MAAADSSVETSYSVRETTTFESSPRPPSFSRNVIINRTSSSLGVGGRGSVVMEKSSRVGNVFQPVPDGMYTTIATTGSSKFEESRHQEKRDMQDLNSRFAYYLERVTALEALNRGLANDLGRLKTKWGKETAQIKAMYQAELDEARQELDDALKENARLEIKVTSIEEEIDNLRLLWEGLLQLSFGNNDKLESQNDLLIEYESQIQLLRRSVDTLEKDREKTRILIVQVEESLANARRNLDDTTLAHIDSENRGQTLEEEIEFTKRIHEQEMAELTALAGSGKTAESRDYWKTEVAQAIKEIEQLYEDKMQIFATSIKASYEAQVRQMEEPTKANMSEQHQLSKDCSAMKLELTDLRDRLNQLSDLNRKYQQDLDALRRRKEQKERELELFNVNLKSEAHSVKIELDGILRQLNLLVDTKHGLEMEIAAYRKLLNGEEIWLSTKGDLNYISGIDDLLSTPTPPESDIDTRSRGELRAKTTFETSAKGALSISKCAPSGHSVQIENKGRKDESMVGWQIIRTNDGKPGPEFTFNDAYGKITPRQKITVWAQDKKPPKAPLLDTEISAETWGVGFKVITKLKNPEGEERATHVQTTVYS